MPTKNTIISVITLILFFLILVVVLLVFINNKKKENLFLPVNYYFVYADKHRKEQMLYTKKEEVKKLGGANEIYLHKNEHYLIVNVYLDKSEAETVLKNIKQKYSNAGVLRITTSTFSKSIKKEIVNSYEIKNTLKRVNSNFKEVLEMQMGLLSDIEKKNNVISILARHRLEIYELKSKFEKNESVFGKIIVKYMDIDLIFYEEIFEKYYAQSGNRVHLLNNFAVKLALNQIKLINNLSVLGK